MEVKTFIFPEVKQIFPKVFRDERGYFFESFKKPFLEEIGIFVEFVQENCSLSCKNTLRGMHFQSEPGQDKLVHVSQGKIFDVIMDIRIDSPTFKKAISVELTEDIPSFLFIPKGFAHGFYVLSEKAKVQYKVSSLYNPKTEKGFYYQEAKVNWPTKTPILSLRDKEALTLEGVIKVSV